MKKVLFGLVLLLSQVSFAEDDVKELPPLDPGYMGVHGMVIVTHGSSLYASHLPLYNKPHNVQLLYKLDNKDLAVLQTVRDSQLVTIKPKPFNLQRLMRGEKMVIQADLYAGHFERDGMLVYENISLSFDKQLYVRSFDDIKPSSKTQEYDVISLRKNYKFYIHRIQQAPSFDHILGVDLEAGCLSRFNTSSPVPKETELQYKFINCGTIKPLYFETQDFNAADSH
ncbi:hypothetical protein [Colwellia psychrerythraea]|uniref:Uncharacterized protein n=1 Tax=Colwellia psychrerythraea TaxID=28229 RepID=A0A099KK30_COLPS|nr:hypothetical protein [Colwellia psychrerythraea]KGJ90332.1 hypothetical protein ND2E_3480 [Colwellia psychrerythraea]